MDQSTRARALVFALAATSLAYGASAMRPATAAAQTCPPPTNLIATDGTRCSDVGIAWSGARIGPNWKIYRGAGHVTPVLIATVLSSPYLDTTAEPGTVYEYYVFQTGTACGTHPAFAGPEEGSIARPGTPTGLSADDGLSCKVVNVSWNAALYATSYELRRGTNPDLAEASVLATTTSTSFADSTADPMRDHWYWVRAKNGASCVGAFQAAGEPGSVKHPRLPDLVVNPRWGSIYTQITLPDGRQFMQVFGGAANAGTEALLVFPKTIPHYDGSKDFLQHYVDCSDRSVDRNFGRFHTLAGQMVTFPHFVRIRLRVRTEVGGVGRIVGEADLPGHCLRDAEVYDSTIVNSPPTPQFTGCTSEIRGVSIGWSTGAIGGSIALQCVGSGAFWLEQIIDPDDLILELDETNNSMMTPLTLSNVPSPPVFPTCTVPPMDARMLGPESLAVAVGAPTDSIVATVWAAEITEPAGPPTLPDFVDIGYVSADQIGSLGDPWVWVPAEWRRQDGPNDVFVSSLTFPAPGRYLVAYRLRHEDGGFLLCDLDGTQNGFSSNQACVVQVMTTTDAGVPEMPRELSFAVRSNPARGGTRFALELPEPSSARVDIFDVRGRRVSKIDAGSLDAGPHTIEWDGRDQGGARAQSGIYLARLETSAGARLTTKFLAVAR